jgi:2'-5' RNA ligase
MAYAVTLRLDGDAAARVHFLWDALVAAGFANQAARLGYEPHLTLALLDDPADAPRLREIVSAISAHWYAMPLSLSAVAAFPAAPATLWLAPTVTAPLLKLHAALCAALPLVRPHYRPAAWIPHVTLADDVDSGEVGQAINVIAERFHPFTAILDRVDLLRLHPISLLWHARLAAADTHS